MRLALICVGVLLFTAVVAPVRAETAGAEESCFRFLMRNRMTPMVGDWQVGKVAPELKALGAEFLESPDKWR
jgi:hypothetical protein